MSRRRPGSRFHAAIPWRQWARLRRRILERDGYRCRACGRPGKLEVDHVTPLHRGGAALDEANLQALCTGCHLQKTMRERGGPPDPDREAGVNNHRELTNSGRSSVRWLGHRSLRVDLDEEEDLGCGRCGKPRSSRFSKVPVDALFASMGTVGVHGW